MELKKVADKLGLEIVSGGDALNAEVTGGYISDLLSDVMANAGEGALWITIQTHTNIVAVSSLNDLAGVLIARGKRPNDETVAEAKKQGVAILVSEESTFDVAGKLYEMGIRGTER